MRYLPTSFEKGHVGARVRFFVKKEKPRARGKRDRGGVERRGNPTTEKGKVFEVFFRSSFSPVTTLGQGLFLVRITMEEPAAGDAAVAASLFMSHTVVAMRRVS